MTTTAPASLPVLPFFSEDPSTLKSETCTNFDDLIPILQRCSKLKKKFSALNAAIKSFTSYVQSNVKKEKSFNFYTDLLPCILKYAAEVPEKELIERLPVMTMNKPSTLTVKPRDVRCILANAFLLNISLAIQEHFEEQDRLIGALDFTQVYCIEQSESIERVICQLSYFYQQSKNEAKLCDEREDIVFVRTELTAEATPKWETRTEDFADAKFVKETLVKLHDKSMEETPARGFVDFANRYIHIGKIIPSLTQEEVLFSCCPESFLTLLICESLNDNEVMVMKNLVRYSDYSGYLTTFKFTGFYETLGHRLDVIIIDATTKGQFLPQMLYRDLGKAYLGFLTSKDVEISTGHWGCGAFGGDKTLKFIQQLCAARVAGVKLQYSVFKDKFCLGQLTEVLDLVISKKATVSQLYNIMSTFITRPVGSPSTFREYFIASLKKL